MPLHVTGDKCPACRRRGLVLGGFNPLTGSSLNPVFGDPLAFRPMGWRIRHLECVRAVCPRCGLIIAALAPRALAELRKTLSAERAKETVTYYPRTKRRPKES